MSAVEITTYTGTRAFFPHGKPLVTVNTRCLSPEPSQRIRNHSPDGFEWGYGGSGPAQLALALLLDALGSSLAQRFYMEFKSNVIASLDPAKPWSMTKEWIRDWWKTRADTDELVELHDNLTEARIMLEGVIEDVGFAGLREHALVEALARVLDFMQIPNRE